MKWSTPTQRAEDGMDAVLERELILVTAVVKGHVRKVWVEPEEQPDESPIETPTEVDDDGA